ncbi:MAG: OmpA family protein [Elusimicrobia bacterium]|nr:OmpA family protein [Elusimicrobiota bacterium]
MKKSMIFLIIFGLIGTGCTSPRQKTAVGAGTGAAVGAATGAVIGHQSGQKGKGAAVGAAAGAVLGGAIGNYLDKQAKELKKVAETKRTEEGIVTTLRNNILFDSESSALIPQALDSVNQISDIIKKYPEDRIIVVGHTDDRGTDVYNERLSMQRAQAVKLQMVARGIPEKSVEVMGQGESQPVAANATDEGRTKNRRVELHITVDQAQLQ